MSHNGENNDILSMFKLKYHFIKSLDNDGRLFYRLNDRHRLEQFGSFDEN